jgi:hypothetical protein
MWQDICILVSSATSVWNKQIQIYYYAKRYLWYYGLCTNGLLSAVNEDINNDGWKILYMHLESIWCVSSTFYMHCAKFHFNIILLFSSGSAKWLFLKIFPYVTLIYLSPRSRYVSRTCSFLDLNYLTVTRRPVYSYVTLEVLICFIPWGPDFFLIILLPDTWN